MVRAQEGRNQRLDFRKDSRSVLYPAIRNHNLIEIASKPPPNWGTLPAKLVATFHPRLLRLLHSSPPSSGPGGAFLYPEARQ